ncbi:MAG: PaaI family thioesterase [Chloroflexota bacterium]
MSEEAGLRELSGEAYRRCFGCGAENPIGLRLAFRREAGGARAEFAPRPELQGWDGVLHGGIILTLLDETLAYAALFAVGPAVTAEIRARLRRPAPLDEVFQLFGVVDRARHGLIEARATMTDRAGQVIAEADAKFMRMR